MDRILTYLASMPAARRAPSVAASSRATLDLVALFAAGMLALAVVAHVIFVVGERARRQAERRASRDAGARGPHDRHPRHRQSRPRRPRHRPH